MPNPLLATIQTFNIEAKTAFLDALKSGTPTTYDRISMPVPVRTKVVEFPMLADISGLREWVGDRQFTGLKASNYTASVKKFERSLEISREAVEDDNLGLFVKRFSALGEKVRIFPDQLIWNLLNAGETELCYDGQAFFSASHPENGSTASNLTTGAGAAWYLFDTTQVTKPIIHLQRTAPEFQSYEAGSDASVFYRDTYEYGVRVRAGAAFGMWQLAFKSKATLDDTNLNAAITSMMSRKNDVGENLGIQPNLLVVPISLRSTARALIDLPTLTGGAANPNYKALDWFVCSRLT